MISIEVDKQAYMLKQTQQECAEFMPDPDCEDLLKLNAMFVEKLKVLVEQTKDISNAQKLAPKLTVSQVNKTKLFQKWGSMEVQEWIAKTVELPEL